MGYSKKTYNKRKAEGLCVLCGAKAREGKTLCQRCFDYQMEYNKKRQSNPKKAMELSDRRIERYERRKREHCCTGCGKPLPQDNKGLMCEKCTERTRIACRKYANKIRGNKGEQESKGEND